MIARSSLFTLLALVTFATLPTTLPAQDRANPFTGKIVYLQLRGEKSPSVALSDMQTRELGGTRFLVGKRVSLNPPNEASKGVTQWVNISEIAAMTEYKDLDTYRKARTDFAPQP